MRTARELDELTFEAASLIAGVPLAYNAANTPVRFPIPALRHHAESACAAADG